MSIRAEKKLPRLLVMAALLAPSAFSVQAEFIERRIEAPNLMPNVLLQSAYRLISEESIAHDLRGISNTKDITLSVNDAGQLVIRNNTVRKFSDLNVIINGTGTTIDKIIQPRTTVTVALTDIVLNAQTTLIRLEPYGVYSPNANGFNDSVEKDIWIDVYADIQRNMMKFYSRADTYDDYRHFFWVERDESMSSSLGKWHKTATYDIPKNYRIAHKAAGLASGSWLALAAYTLDRSFTITDSIYTSHYGTFSHEYGHTMGFKHGSGMAYGWDDPVRAGMFKLIEDGVVNRVASGDTPTVHDANFFLHFDEKAGLTFYQKPDANFIGIDWVNVVYNDENIALSETRIKDNKIIFDVAKNNHDKILFNARLTGQEYMANLTYQTQDREVITLGTSIFSVLDMGENVKSSVIVDVNSAAAGPTEPVLNVGTKTRFTFPVTSQSGENMTIQAWGDKRYIGCDWKPMEDASACAKRHQESFNADLRITISSIDNPALTAGQYTGMLALTQIDYLDRTKTKLIELSGFVDPTPTVFAAEQAQHEKNRLDLVNQLPPLEGSLINSTQSDDAFSFNINGEVKTLCYFHAVKKDLTMDSLLGFVEGDSCSIGASNSYKGQPNFSSNSYLTFNRHSMQQQDDNIMIHLP